MKRISIGLAYWVVIFASIKIVADQWMSFPISFWSVIIALYSTLVMIIGLVSFVGFLMRDPKEEIAKAIISQDEPLSARIKKLIVMITTMGYFIFGIFGIAMFNAYIAMALMALCVVPLLFNTKKGYQYE